MSEETCACPKCDCKVTDQSPEANGKLYCCQACADGHTDGSKGCGHNCACG
ncbi:metallothionein [Salinicola socius]|uniref:Metallothionein n=1 Tax=Salinicola socius TaxID=404433 RepID=A0A1Q8SV70_9GAMM|nr:metallothionein [Salinicola socius]OLO05310.1 metallothionein [Salinicola socius]